MTTHWIDFKNTDCILNCGSNSVENHPLSSRWLNRAHENGAPWIVVDPRYTRTAEKADIYCRIRSGTDIAFYGGMINYIFENDRWQHEYVLNYTNATYLLDPGFAFDAENGLWSGWDEESRKYSAATWHYQTEKSVTWDTSPTGKYSWVKDKGVPEFTPPELEIPKTDPTLKNEMCVLNQMKKHFSRYTLDKVSSITGADEETLELVYKTYTAVGAPDKTGVILYALGQTQHTYGTQNIRCMTIIQLLLGNIGCPGGGLAALRGEPNVQGATDMCMMPTDLPGYLKWMNTTDNKSLRAWCENQTYSNGYYTNKPKFIVSFLKEFFGKNGTYENDYGYDWLPKVPSGVNFTISSTWEQMKYDVIKGYFVWGMNPGHSTGNTNNCHEGMSHLDWLVDCEWHPTETSEFWRAPNLDPSQIMTECYYLPAALIYERAGTIINSGRWLQHRYAAVEPWGDSKPDYEICDLLFTAIRDLYEQEGGANPDPILKTKWDYYVDGKIDPVPVAWAMNGYRVENTNFEEGKVDLLSSFAELKADGSTSNLIWIWSGFWNNNDAPFDVSVQPHARRNLDDPSGLGLYPGWAFCWPANRRHLYNRASADLNGKPWNEKKCLVEWHPETRTWTQYDNADFVWGTAEEPVEPDNQAFIMLWEQNARLESYAIADGPLPEHYEPYESPTTNIMNGRQNAPMYLHTKYGRADQEDTTKQGSAEDYPIVATTYSCTEHWQSGSQTNSCPVLAEAVPTQYIELSEELAAEKGITYGDKVRVFNNRGSVLVDAFITKRMKPMTINGKLTHQIGMIHHFGWTNPFGTQDLINDLTPNVGDGNTGIPEYKAFLVDIEKA